MKTVQEIKSFIDIDYELRNHHKFAKEILYKQIEIIIDPHLICKATNQIENDESLNDTLQYWIEVLIPYEIDWSLPDSKYHYQSHSTHGLMHDSDLDCGGYTYEEAITEAHRLMCEKYGPTSIALIDNANQEAMGNYERFNKSGIKRSIEEFKSIQDYILDFEYISNQDNYKKAILDNIAQFVHTIAAANCEYIYFNKIDNVVNSNFITWYEVSFSTEIYKFKKIEIDQEISNIIIRYVTMILNLFNVNNIHIGFSINKNTKSVTELFEFCE